MKILISVINGVVDIVVVVVLETDGSQILNCQNVLSVIGVDSASFNSTYVITKKLFSN